MYARYSASLSGRSRWRAERLLAGQSQPGPADIRVSASSCMGCRLQFIQTATKRISVRVGSVRRRRGGHDVIERCTATLMRTVATLQTPTEGAIRFDDVDVIAEPEKLRRTLGYLPQDFGVYPRVSAYEMLDHIARPRSKRSFIEPTCGAFARRCSPGFPAACASGSASRRR
jgi:hypothetical protein